MTRRIPIIPTILVVAAAATMGALGIWQLGRADEKAALLARYVVADENLASVPFPLSGEGEEALYRRSELTCEGAISKAAGAGTSAKGEKGWAHKSICQLDGGAQALLYLGWSRDPNSPAWDGGEVQGIIGPGPRLVLDPPVAGLAPLAKPDPQDLPNNHLAYAGQWFLFAITALIIYAFALRRRWRDEERSKV